MSINRLSILLDYPILCNKIFFKKRVDIHSINSRKLIFDFNILKYKLLVNVFTMIGKPKLYKSIEIH